MHYDGNYLVDVVLAFAVRDLAGGDHVMYSVDGKEAIIIVETQAFGTVSAASPGVVSL